MEAVVLQVDDDDVVPPDGAQGDVVCRVCVGGPVKRAACLVKDAMACEEAQRFGRLLWTQGSEGIAALEGKLERRALQMLNEDFHVVRIDAGLFDRRPEQIAGFAREVLIERRARGHKNADALTTASTGSSDPLPRGRDRPGIAGTDDGIELPDVDAEFERIRGHDRKDFTVPKSPFDVAPLGRQVTSPIGHDASGIDAAGVYLRPVRYHGVAQIPEHDFHRVARLSEYDSGHTRAHEIGREHHGLLHVARTDPERFVHDRRIEEEEPPLSLWRAARVDELDVRGSHAEEPRSVLARVSDGCGGS